jgi:V/A-type H+-transporting ATPase subunit I
MKSVTIIGHAGDREGVMARLHQLGVMQLADVNGELASGAGEGPPGPGTSPGTATSGSGGNAAAARAKVSVQAQHKLAEADRRLGELTICLNYFSRWAPIQKGLVESFLAARDDVAPEAWEQAGKFDATPIVRACQQGEARLGEIRARETELANLMKELQPLAAMSLDLGALQDTEQVAVFFGQGQEHKVTALAQALASAGALHHVARLGSIGRQVYFAVFHFKNDPSVAELLRTSGVEAATMPVSGTTAAAAIRDAEGELAALAAERSRIADEGRELAKHRMQLYAVYDRWLLARQRFEAQALLGETESTFVVRGWCPADVAEHIEHALSAGGAAVAVEARDPRQDEQPPVLLANRKGSAPFEIVTNIYGWPSYREVDPTPVLAPFFALFFALALTDAGYGILMVAYCWWMMRKPRTPKGSHKFFRLMLIGGALTIVTGALTGGWFGNALDFLPEQAGFVTRLKDAMLLLDPVKNPMPFMAMSLVLGLLHLMTGIGVKAYMAVRQGRVLDAVLDQGLWLILLPSLGLAAAGSIVGDGVAQAGRFASLAAVAGLLLTQGRAAPSIVGKAFGGLYSLYGLIGYLSDTLSYTRLFALGLATASLGMAINQIALMLRPVPFVGLFLTLAIMAAGHMISLLINAFGAFIHSGRLQFVEFFTKFFEGGGKAFKPFAERPRFTQVTQD